MFKNQTMTLAEIIEYLELNAGYFCSNPNFPEAEGIIEVAVQELRGKQYLVDNYFNVHEHCPSCSVPYPVGQVATEVGMYLQGRHPGLFHCPLDYAAEVMPELEEVFESAPIPPRVDYTVDVKVHMLMPGQFPCIPNWHCDFIPRDENKNKRPELVNPEHKMFLWLSGPPLTEFADGREVRPREWVEFTQLDEHRGTPSEEFTWRTFIRLVPSALCPPESPDKWLRRHTQVYLDAENFEW